MNAVKTGLIPLFFLIGLTMAIPARSDVDQLSVGRYLVASNQAMPCQADPLLGIIQVHFPSSVQTMGDAIRHVMRFSGYRVVDENQLTPEIRNLLKLSLPNSDRVLGPISLKDGLQTLVGEPFGLLIDPVHRLISFRLLAAYSLIYQTKSVLKF